MPTKQRLIRQRVKRVLDVARKVYETSNIDPASGNYFSESEVAGRHCACAIGAAVYGILKETNVKLFHKLRCLSSNERDELITASDEIGSTSLGLKGDDGEMDGVIHGFDDGFDGNQPKDHGAGESFQEAYKLAYKFGKEMREAK